MQDSVPYKRSFAQLLYDMLEYYHVEGWPEDDMTIHPSGDCELYIWKEEKDGQSVRKAKLHWTNDSLMLSTTHWIELVVPDTFPERFFVTKYLRTREYGGPEEGGWYYNCETPQVTYNAFSEDYAQTLLKTMNEGIEKPEHPIYSVLSTGEEFVRVEKHMPITTPKPYYC